MSFDQSTITDVSPVCRDADLAVSWTSTAPAGTWFQLYLGGVWTWCGTERTAVVPMPPANVRIDVGAVLPDEAELDLSADLTASPGGGSRINLGWLGGSFESPNLAGWHVYTGTAPGGAGSYTAPAGSVTAYPGGIVTDGWGLGGWNSGGWGSTAGAFSWTSAPVLSGVWNVAVVPFDSAGNEGTGTTGTVTIAGPPQPPARNAAGRRVTAAVDYGSGDWGAGAWGSGGWGAASAPFVVLNWLASPGA